MDRKNTTETGLVIVTALMILFVVSVKSWIIFLAITVSAVFILIPPLALIIHKAWMGLADLLGRIVPRLLLSLVWIVILTPLAFIYRLTGHDDLKLKRSQNSQFSDCPKEYSPVDFEKPW